MATLALLSPGGQSILLLCVFTILSIPNLASVPSLLVVSSSPAAARKNVAARSAAPYEFLRDQTLGRHSHGHGRGLASHPPLPQSKRRYLAAIDGAPAPAPSRSTAISAPSPAPVFSSKNTGAGGTGTTKKKHPRAVRWLVGIALGMATGFVSAIVLSVAFHYVRRRLRKNKLGKPVIYQKGIDAKSLAFLKEEGAFDGMERLGRGASGAVYKATLEVSRTGNGEETQTKTVAIKKVMGMVNVVQQAMAAKDGRGRGGDGSEEGVSSSYDLTKNSAQIYAEMETLGKVRHRNLVTLLAYVPTPNAHILIYDFMANGSLHDVLKRSWEGEIELPWKIRLDIAIGVAMGLKYLHCDATPRIIHRDLKPGNILIDDNMEARIGDFGLAKAMADPSFTHVTGSNWAGTVGFAAPEYNQTIKYTTMGDIFSFGVILVVLLTGKEPTDDMFADVVTHMGDWVNDILASGIDRAISVLDPRLLSPDGHGSLDREQMLLALKIAAFCLQDVPSARPSSKDVLQMLQQIRRPSLTDTNSDRPIAAAVAAV